MSAARSARRPVPALVFLLVLAVLAVVVWVRVSGRDSTADAGGASCGTAAQLPALSAITVTVLNGNGANQLAGNTLNQFTALGFAPGNVGDADATPGVGVITAGPNGAGSALAVSFYLPGATITADGRADLGVTVTLGAQFTGLATAEQGAAAQQQASVSITPAPTTAPATPGAGSTTSAPTSAAPTATCLTTPPFPTPSAFLTSGP